MVRSPGERFEKKVRRMKRTAIILVSCALLLSSCAVAFAGPSLAATNSRKTYNLAKWIPSGRASIVVNCPSPVIVERSMYWGGRGFGTDTLGDYSN
jgi:hypothetical protein